MIRILGIGPGTSGWVLPAVVEMVHDCDVLLGGPRALKLFPKFEGDTFLISGKLKETLEILGDVLSQGKKVGVLVSGDPGFYSLLPLLKREFPLVDIRVLPGISSMQFAFARAGIPWQDAELFSVHGRSLRGLPLNLVRPLGILTGGEHTPQKVAEYYQVYGFNPRISLGNALTYPNEQWLELDAEELKDCKDDFANAVMIIYPGEETERKSELLAHSPKGLSLGIRDEEFIRGKVPMTKSEVRVQVLAKAKIGSCDRVLDVGAGTGSLSIEAALLAQRGCVYAVEENPVAQELIVQNRKKFRTENLRLVCGTAPGALTGIPPMDVCLIGGSHGQILDILRQAPLVPGGRVVITAVTLETLTLGMEALKNLDYQDVDVVSIQAVRWQGIKDIHLAQAQNPVFILSAQKSEE